MIRIDVDDAVTIHSPHGVLVVRAPSDDPMIPMLSAALEATNGAFRDLAQTIIKHNFNVPAIACVTTDPTGQRIFLFGDITANVEGVISESLVGTGRSTWIEQDLHPDASISIESSASGHVQSSRELNPSPDALTVAASSHAEVSPPDVSPVSAAPSPVEPLPVSTPPITHAPSPLLVPDPNLIGVEASPNSKVTSLSPDLLRSQTDEPAEPQRPIVVPQEPAAASDAEVTLDADSVRDRLSSSTEGSAETSGPLVTAKVCPCGAANPLTLSECRTCGSSLRREGVTIGQAARPPLGFIVFDDGFRHEIATHVVVGRSAPTDHRIGEQVAVAITVTSPQKHVSKAHIEVRLIDWTVNVVDLDSANGTYVEGTDGRSPRRLRPNVVEQIMPGDVVQFGDRSFTFEAADGL